MRSEPRPEGWPLVPLKELISVHHGFAFAGEFFRDEGPGDILLTPGNFAIGGGFSWSKRKYYGGPIDDRFVLRRGDLIVTMTDLSKASDTLGSPAWVPAAPDGSRLLHNQRLGRVEITAADRLDPAFLYAALRTRSYRAQVVASATGTTVRHTSPARIAEAVIPLPSLRDQRRVAAVARALDDKIDSNRRLAGLLEEAVATLFRARFLDFVGVEEFEDSEIGRIPAGWNVFPIGDALSVVGGATPSTKEPAYWDGGIHCWATPKDLSGHTSPVLIDTSRHVTDEGAKRISSGLLPPETVLLSSRAPIGYTVISKVQIAVNQGFIAIPPSEHIPSEYVLFWLRQNMETIKNNAGGTTFAEISKRGFRPIPMLVPPGEQLMEFRAAARPMLDLVASLDRERLRLALCRDALLPRLISGELRLPETADGFDASDSRPKR